MTTHLKRPTWLRYNEERYWGVPNEHTIRLYKEHSLKQLECAPLFEIPQGTGIVWRPKNYRPELTNGTPVLYGNLVYTYNFNYNEDTVELLIHGKIVHTLNGDQCAHPKRLPFSDGQHVIYDNLMYVFNYELGGDWTLTDHKGIVHPSYEFGDSLENQVTWGGRTPTWVLLNDIVAAPENALNPLFLYNELMLIKKQLGH